MTKESDVKIIQGGEHTDHRGTLKFFNDFDLKPIKRFYVTENPDSSIIRAWQAHQAEKKWFYVIEGIFKVVLVKPDDWLKPSTDLTYEEFILDVKQNQVLAIPAGYATGFQGLAPNSKLMIFSDVNLEESLADDFRFDKDLWYKW